MNTAHEQFRQEQAHEQAQGHLVREQSLITSCALDVIQTVAQQRGRPLQPRDRMALKLLTPRNAALMVKGDKKHLGCRQVSFEILTDDPGLGSYRLVPVGVHVLNPKTQWWSDEYGIGRFLWNLYLGEEPVDGMHRILERLFKLPGQDLGPAQTHMEVLGQEHDIQASVRPDLDLYIRRHKGSIETSLRRLHRSGGLRRASELGLDTQGQGRLALVFGKSRRYAVSFAVERA
jgi:hypothetical protein